MMHWFRNELRSPNPLFFFFCFFCFVLVSAGAGALAVVGWNPSKRPELDVLEVPEDRMLTRTDCGECFVDLLFAMHSALVTSYTVCRYLPCWHTTSSARMMWGSGLATALALSAALVPTKEYFSMHMSEGAEILRLAMFVYLSGSLSARSWPLDRFSSRVLVSEPRDSLDLHLDDGTGPRRTGTRTTGAASGAWMDEDEDDDIVIMSKTLSLRRAAGPCGGAGIPLQAKQCLHFCTSFLPLALEASVCSLV
mmetsp:Transcript_1462/g.4217  ORF Transcript_1462/g.4217 Transcript_1462/m.4217 type:complete len:251 (+) Transcript_1462:620-1372(+)